MQDPEPVTSYRALLQVPSVARILTGMTVSRVAGSMFGIAIVLFTLQRFGDPSLAGLVTFAGVAPGLLLSPIAGALLDRHGRARLIVIDQLIAVAGLVTLGALALAGSLPVPVLIAITTLTGITAPLSAVGLRTLFPLIVPRHLWVRVNAMDANGYVIATLVGPPAAGLLVQVIGGPQAIIAIGLLYAVSVAVFLGVPDPPNVARTTGRLLVDAWQGLRYTLLNPTLRGLGIALGVNSIASGIVAITIPVIVIRQLGLGEAAVGAVFAVSGVSGGIAAVLVGRIRLHGRERGLLAGPPFVVALGALAILASPTLPVLIGVMAMTGFLHGPMDVALYTLRQRRTDPAWMGRAYAVSMSLNFIGYPFGAAIGGALLANGIAPAIWAIVATTVSAGVFARLLLPGAEPGT